MKATLTIEVPDDFEKGDCCICPILSRYDGQCRVLKCYRNSKDDCPLGAGEENTDETN